MNNFEEKKSFKDKREKDEERRQVWSNISFLTTSIIGNKNIWRRFWTTIQNNNYSIPKLMTIDTQFFTLSRSRDSFLSWFSPRNYLNSINVIKLICLSFLKFLTFSEIFHILHLSAISSFRNSKVFWWFEVGSVYLNFLLMWEKL